jgi:peptidoglycan LD-endopeptidase CwlK
MPSFGKHSRSRLDTCHPDLVVLMEEVVKHYDTTIMCGVRSKEDQNAAVQAGRSRTPWPKSKHNVKNPGDLSRAVDAAPYYGDEKPTVNWDTSKREILKRWSVWCGFVLGTAAMLYAEGKMAHRVRGGIDWDGDWKFNDQTLHDLPHFELIGA